jgi:hypothetical protein
LPLSFTVIELESSVQSQAAQVFSFMNTPRRERHCDPRQ